MRKNALQGKVAVITGAGSGIGRSTALLMSAHGARLHIADINPEAIAAVAEQVNASGGQATAHVLDVSKPDEVTAFADKVFAAEGRVDVLHNNAGIGHGGNIEANTMDDWTRVVSINLLGVAYGCQAFIPRMLKQGGGKARVVNTASLVGIYPSSRMAPYTASKFGVVGLTEALNSELSPKGIRVSAVCPGIIATPIVEKGIMRGELGEMHQYANRFYAKHGTHPDKVAKVVLRAAVRPKLILPTPLYQTLVPYWLHRISPRMVQGISRIQSEAVRYLGR